MKRVSLRRAARVRAALTEGDMLAAAALVSFQDGTRVSSWSEKTTVTFLGSIWRFRAVQWRAFSPLAQAEEARAVTTTSTRNRRMRGGIATAMPREIRELPCSYTLL